MCYSSDFYQCLECVYNLTALACLLRMLVRVFCIQSASLARSVSVYWLLKEGRPVASEAQAAVTSFKAFLLVCRASIYHPVISPDMFLIGGSSRASHTRMMSL